ncbi:GFA family protein [Aminobacter ciceronei]|uniref:GFA family protein n=1 Tax=Aminobacter ciceronei TaxID=150723 RepID=UPI001FE3D75D|nr:GFA family protein [Aminobacter ciceronei]
MFHCFCQSCRKSHASDHNTAAPVARSDFQVVSGGDALNSYESTPGKLRWFCSSCGTHIYAERPQKPEVVVVRAGTFDSDPGVVPTHSVWMSHARPWLSYDASKPTYPEWP